MVGDTVLSYVRPAFVNSYPGVCGRWRERQTRVRAGERVSLQSPLVSLPPRLPRAAATHGDPCQEPEHGWMGGRRTRRRSLIAGVGLHTKTTLLHGYLQQYIIIIIIRFLTHLVSFNRRIISAERSHFKCCRMRDCTIQI